MRKEIEVLEDHTDFGAHALNVTNVIIKMDTVNNNAALLMLFQMVDTADRRRFAGAGRSAQYDAFTGLTCRLMSFSTWNCPYHLFTFSSEIINASEECVIESVM